MNKHFRVITINGVKGIITAIFIVMGLIAGFIISPGWVCMQIWNKLFEDSNLFSKMSLYQGIMLWAIIALTLYALNKKQALIGFGSYTGLNPEQIRDIMERTKNNDNKFIKEFEEKTAIIEKETTTETVKSDDAEEVKN